MNLSACSQPHLTAGHRALRAAEAGVYLAQLLGLATPISAAQMWQYAREGIIPVVRLGRRVWFQIQGGGATHPQRPAQTQGRRAGGGADSPESWSVD